jgi:myo-inositol-1(or 4)-monophosphatase
MRQRRLPGLAIRRAFNLDAAMNRTDDNRRLELGCAIAREAGALALAAFRKRSPQPAPAFKGHQDYITETDGVIEGMVRKRIGATFPADSFFGEEAGGTFGNDVWVVDPIDGTANFARGMPHFCVSIGFVRDGRPELGVIYQPVTDELYAARRGCGALLNGRPIKVSGMATMSHAIVEAGWSTRRPLKDYIVLVERLFTAGAQVQRAGSGALGLAYVADGRLDAYCELHINAWDALAGLLLVEEAGGVINDFLANDGLRRGNPAFGCTPALRDIVVDAMGLAARR